MGTHVCSYVCGHPYINVSPEEIAAGLVETLTDKVQHWARLHIRFLSCNLPVGRSVLYSYSLFFGGGGHVVGRIEQSLSLQPLF